MRNNKGILQIVRDWFWNPTRDINYYDPLKGVLHYTEAREFVSETKGAGITTVSNCLNVLAREVASTPADVRQETARGKEKVKNNPIHTLIHTRPNPRMTAFSFWYAMTWNYNSWGNAYAFIQRDRQMNPVALIPLQPYDVDVKLESGKVRYIYKDENIPDWNILHFKQYTFDGLRGISPILHNAEIMGYKLKQDKYAARVLGTKPPGYFKSGGDFKGDMEGEVKKWNTAITGDGVSGTPFLEDLEYKPLMIPPNEGQHIETKKYTDEQIFGIFNVPPNFVQNYDQGLKANSEQQALQLVKHTLTPHYMIIEQECNYKLFSEDDPFYIKFNANSKLRGDIQARKEFYQVMRTLGLMSADEIRELEDVLKQPDGIGEKYFIQGAMGEITKDGIKMGQIDL